jgi:hypothetical protein
MGLNYPFMGESYVPAYQISATPWVTSSNVVQGAITEVTFSHVSRFFVIKNNGSATSAIAVGFTRTGLAAPYNNYFILSGSESFSADLRVSRIFISGSGGGTVPYTIIAGLTNISAIDQRFFLPVTSSNGFAGVG